MSATYCLILSACLIRTLPYPNKSHIVILSTARNLKSTHHKASNDFSFFTSLRFVQNDNHGKSHPVHPYQCLPTTVILRQSSKLPLMPSVQFLRNRSRPVRNSPPYPYISGMQLFILDSSANLLTYGMRHFPAHQPLLDSHPQVVCPANRQQIPSSIVKHDLIYARLAIRHDRAASPRILFYIPPRMPP